jgi:NADH-quinone oxidoreductase subunit A
LLNNFCNIEQFDVIFHFNKSGFDFLIAILVSAGLIVFLLTQANLLNSSFFPNSTFDAEKYSPYECGFAPFKTERSQFDIKFYLVALLFLVFDVELMFLLPYCLSYYYLGVTGYLVFILFFSLLLIGFLVEWASGMLIWKGDQGLDNFNFKTFKIKKLEQFVNPYNYYNYMFYYINHLDNKQLFK